jgi:hypothetical protein
MKEISTTPAAGARLKRSRDGSFVCGPLRVHPRARTVAVRTAVPHLPPDERERREHVRRWARMMIVHLERSDFDMRQEGYAATLRRLQELLEREIERASAD